MAAPVHATRDELDQILAGLRHVFGHPQAWGADQVGRPDRPNSGA